MIVARVKVMLKKGILDPEGKTIYNALPGIGIEGVDSILTGKYFELHFDKIGMDAAKSATEETCDKLLANPVIENYTYELDEE